MTLTTEQLSAVETTKEFRALLKYMRAIAKAEPESAKEKCELEPGLWQYASQKTIKAIVEHIDALEFAVAANREAQPVAYLNKFSGVCMTLEQQPNAADDVAVYSPLYTAPPAPAVPEKCPEHVRSLMNIHADDLFDDADAQEIWNACRAAMLAQPVSQGYTLPEGWIACGERMPDADGEYWCWFGKEKPSVIQQRVCIWNDRNHEWCDSAVTHWMPLPAAPEGGN